MFGVNWSCPRPTFMQIRTVAGIQHVVSDTAVGSLLRKSIATSLHWLHYTQLQLHYTTTTAALHHTTSSSCGCNHCNHSKKHNSNHLSVHQWIRSAIHASQQLNYSVLSLKLPPPPCAVLLVCLLSLYSQYPITSHYIIWYHYTVYLSLYY